MNIKVPVNTDTQETSAHNIFLQLLPQKNVSTMYKILSVG